RELAIQASNDTYTDIERKMMQEEVNALLEEVNAITGRTEYNTQILLDGSFTNKKIQTGANAGQHISISIEAMTVSSLGLEGLMTEEDATTGGLLTQEDADEAIELFDAALNDVSMQ